MGLFLDESEIRRIPKEDVAFLPEYYEDFKYDDFDLFISTYKHRLKSLGNAGFLDMYRLKPSIVLSSHKLLYLVSMIEMISQEEGIPEPPWISEYKETKLDKLLFPEGCFIHIGVTEDWYILVERFNDSLPEFKAHNIIEISVRDVM